VGTSATELNQKNWIWAGGRASLTGEMEAGRDRVFRRFTIVATSIAAVIVLTADYGPQPDALSFVSDWWVAGKNWLLPPTAREVAELEKRRSAYLARKESDDRDRGQS
jgi:hypothetical protein